ncbi:hypothetical protein EBZ80_04015 [bacterium]|nr:hypothetical protein [bacterium]
MFTNFPGCVMSKKVVLSLGLLLISLTGCVGDESLVNTLDRAFFSRTGRFLFSSYSSVTMKEIHLGLEELRGKKVSIEGRVIEAGKHQTFFIMEDDSARMLVVLTRYPNVLPDLGSRNGKIVRVLGIVGNGKKGLPIVMASAIRTVSDEVPGQAASKG